MSDSQQQNEINQREEQRILRTMNRKSNTKFSQSSNSNLNPSSQDVKKRPSQDSNLIKNENVFDEDYLQQMENQRDAEREMLKNVESSLIKNRSNVMDDLDNILVNLKEQNTKLNTPSASQNPKLESEENNKDIENKIKNRNYLNEKIDDDNNDVDDLLIQINQNLILENKISSPELVTSQIILKQLKSSIPSKIMQVMGLDRSDDIEKEITRYIGQIIILVRPLQDTALSSFSEIKILPFSENIHRFISVTLNNIGIIEDVSVREVIANLSDELIEVSLKFIQSLYNERIYPSNSNELSSSQNLFLLILKKIIQALTIESKKEIEEMQLKTGSNMEFKHNVKQIALYAQSLSENLKKPLFEPESFKNQLTSMVVTIKRASNFITESKKSQLNESLKLLLRSALKLQESPMTGSLHVDVIRNISNLLKIMFSMVTK